MAQAGIHGMVGIAVRRWAPKAEWLMLGTVLGSLLPDTDNLAVAVAVLAGRPTEGLHRTFTHSLFAVLVVLAVFHLISLITKKARWNNLGAGMGVGISLHILLDLFTWFNGVGFMWPFPSWLNLWAGYTPPEWFARSMETGEFLFMALFFTLLGSMARKQKTDGDYLKPLFIWTLVQAALFLLLTVLSFVMVTGYMIVLGLFYLLSLGLAIGVTIRMRDTIEYNPM